MARTGGARVNANQIPVAHTPDGGWRGEMPPAILAACTEPLAAGAPDLRGTWRAIRVEQNDQVLPDHGLNRHVERIEQCGNRVVITAQGIIHDMRADGVLKHGVHDVSGPPNFGQEVHVAAVFNNGRLDLHPLGVREGQPPLVTREIVDGHLIWNYGPFKVTLQHFDHQAER